MKPLTSILIFFAISISVIAQKAAKDASPTPTPERDRAIVALLNDARSAAPELAVDTFLRVVESKRLKEPAWRHEILDEAMRMVDEVKYPIRKQRVFRGNGIVDTASGYMQYAYEQRLDALSLKARIIKDWLLEDKARARQIIFQIGGDLKLKPIRCDEALGYQLDDIYASVGAVAKAAFTPKEIADGVRGLFILPWIENIESPSQIPPVIELLSGLQSPAVERQLLINSFERAITRNFGDDRSFSHAILEAHKFTSFIRSAEDPESLTLTWRVFLAKNSGGPRCLDSEPKNGELPSSVSSFNWMLSEEKRFAVEDFAAVEYEGVPNDRLYLDSETHKKISVLFRRARDKKNRSENKDDKDAQLEWQLKVGEILEALDSWKASTDEPNVEVFDQKTVFYRVLISEITEVETAKRVVRAFMRYLAASPIQNESFIEWLYHARWVLEKHPDLFRELAKEFPNPNFRVMLAGERTLKLH